MLADRKNMSRLSRMFRDRNGNFAIMTALMLPAALFTVGMTVDFLYALDVKTEVQTGIDAATLAASSAMLSTDKTYTTTQAEAEGKQLLLAQLNRSLAKFGNKTLASDLEKNTTIKVVETEDPSGTVYTATGTTRIAFPVSPFTRLFTGEAITIQSYGTSQSVKPQKTGLSMYLVLDRSGSMSFVTEEKNDTKSKCENYTSSSWPNNDTSISGCRIRKIEALKAAAGSLFASFNAIDPNKDLVRVGAIAYTHDPYTAQAPEWGTAKAKTYVDALPYKPEGGTDASKVMKTAYEALKSTNNKESSEHAKKGNSTFKRFILLMTDGEMTGYSNQWNSALDSATRTVCTDAKKDGITIYSVAFMAPQKGKEMLSFCASGSSSYYEATNMQSLIAAFKDIANNAMQSSVRLTN
ncbi:VWA domain-containing protein [Rhizobiaceae bacterium BDR2-2]|uniref:VWA domain-containing protein n=1 Tax=Ectorhizobium quercum TaxID=2965071 RepID=A0AAE3SUA0_9HYPH|nr:TadE/TadG family type IV pilus assembly protein [Ectorhizobium quercum]MCX8996847.1 VWA domain-containing protein [Ectorhizobium quercum]